MVLAVSISPVATRTPVPAMATAIASTHIRMRLQSPKVAMSTTAPIVQKLTRLATAPKTKASAKARPATSDCKCAASIGGNCLTHPLLHPGFAANPFPHRAPFQGEQPANGAGDNGGRDGRQAGNLAAGSRRNPDGAGSGGRQRPGEFLRVTPRERG